MRTRTWLTLLVGICASTGLGRAQTATVLLDLDGDSTTGCSVGTVEGPFEGIEQQLVSALSAHAVTAVDRFECLDPATDTFGPPIAVTDVGPPWPVGTDSGTSGADVVETSFPLHVLSSPPELLRLGFLADDGTGGGDALLTVDGSADGPAIELLLATPTDIPTASGTLLSILAIVLGIAGWRTSRSHRRTALVLVLLAGGAAVPVIVEAVGIILLDGDPTDWPGAVDVSAADVVGDGSPGMDITASLVASDPGGTMLFLRIDTFRDAAPTAVDDAVTVAEDAPPTTLDVLANDADPDGGPISISAVTQPPNGAVVLAPGGADLTYEPDADFCTDPPATSTDDFTYTTAPGGSTATVSVTVTCVNDAPSHTTSSTIATYVEGAPPTILDPTVVLSDVDDTHLQSATLVLAARPDGDGVEALAAATVGTSISASYAPGTGTLSLSGTDSIAHYQQVLRSVTYVNGSGDPTSDGVAGTSDRTVTCVVSDGSATSPASVLGIDVRAVNAPPQVTSPISYAAVGNTLLRVADGLGDGHDTALPGRIASVVDGVNAFAKASPIDSDSPPGQLGFVPGTTSTSSGGSLTVDDDGDFFYLPPVGFQGLDTASVDLVDGDGGATPVSFEITVADMVWYVEDTVDATHNPAGGDGRSTDAFETLAAAQAASAPGQTLLVFETDAPLNESIALQDGQKLYGQRVEEEVVSLLPAGLVLEELSDTDARPEIRPTTGPAVRVEASTESLSGIEIRHLDLGSGDDTALLATSTGSSVVSGLIVAENVMSGAASEGMRIETDHTSGDASITLDGNELLATGDGVRIRHSGAGRLLVGMNGTTVIASSTGNGLDVRSSAGPLVMTSFADTVVSGDVQGEGAFFQNVHFDADADTASLETLDAGAGAFGAPGNGVGGAGLRLEAVSGDLAFTDLDVEGTRGLVVVGTGEIDVGAGTGLRLSAGAGNIVATAGPAVDASPATLGLAFDSVRSVASPTHGIRLVDVAGVFQAGAGSDIQGSSGSAVLISSYLASPLSVTYSGTITNTSGRLIEIDGYPAGGVASFDGLSLFDQGGLGIGLHDVQGDVAVTAFATSLTNSSASGISITGDTDGHLSFDDVSITDPSGTGIEIVDASDRIGATLEWNHVEVSQGTHGARLLEIAGLNGGSVTFDGACDLLATDGTGISIASNAGTSSVTFEAGSHIGLGSSGSRLSDAKAFSMTGNSSGTVVDVHHMDVFTDSRTAITAAGMGQLAFGSSTLDAISAAALDLDSLAVVAELGTVRSTSSPSRGLEITNMPAAAAITVAGPTTIDDPAAEGMLLSGFAAGSMSGFGPVTVSNRNATGISIVDHDGVVAEFGALVVPNPNGVGGSGFTVRSSAAPVTIASATISGSRVTNGENFTNVLRHALVADSADDGDGIFLIGNSGSFTLWGGTISDSDDDLVDLRNLTGAVTFDGVAFRESAQFAIQGVDLRDLTVRDSTFVRITDDSNAAHPFLGEHAVWLLDLAGTNLFEDVSLDMASNRDGSPQFVASVSPPGPDNKGIFLDNQNVQSSFTIRDCDFRNISNDGIQFIAGGTAADGSHDLTVLVEGTSTGPTKSNVFQDMNGRQISVEHRGTVDVNSIVTTVRHTLFEDGGVGMRAAASGGLHDVRIEDNVFSNLDLSGLSTAIRLRAFIDGNLVGRILRNTVEDAGGGFLTFIGNGNDQADVRIEGNTITSNGTFGTLGIQTQQGGAGNFEVVGNSFAAVPRQSGTLGTADTATLCVIVAGNDFSGAPPAFGEGFLFWLADGAPLEIDGWDGVGGNAGAATYLGSTNTVDGAPFVSATFDVFGPLASGTCTTLP